MAHSKVSRANYTALVLLLSDKTKPYDLSKIYNVPMLARDLQKHMDFAVPESTVRDLARDLGLVFPEDPNKKPTVGKPRSQVFNDDDFRALCQCFVQSNLKLPDSLRAAVIEMAVRGT